MNLLGACLVFSMLSTSPLVGRITPDLQFMCTLDKTYNKACAILKIAGTTIIYQSWALLLFFGVFSSNLSFFAVIDF